MSACRHLYMSHRWFRHQWQYNCCLHSLWGPGTVHWLVVSFKDLWLKLAREVPRESSGAERHREWPVLWQDWESIMLTVANECTWGNCSPHSRAIFYHLHIDGRRTLATFIWLWWSTMEIHSCVFLSLLMQLTHFLSVSFSLFSLFYVRAHHLYSFRQEWLTTQIRFFPTFLDYKTDLILFFDSLKSFSIRLFYSR